MKRDQMLLALTVGLAGVAARADECQVGWSAMDCGVNSFVYTMKLWDDDGDGPHPTELYAGGTFTEAGGSPVGNIAKWDGENWVPMGDGFNGWVNTLAVYDDDGDGPHPQALYAGGLFTKSGDTVVNNVAKWNGTKWVAIGQGVGDEVNALVVYDPPGAPKAGLYAGGVFNDAGGNPAEHIARWDGSAWSALGAGVDNIVECLIPVDLDGAGPGTPVLCVGGRFYNAGGQSHKFFATWSGSAWAGPADMPNHWVTTMAVRDDDGNGAKPPAVYVGGLFSEIGNDGFGRIARWDGTNWTAVGGGLVATQMFSMTLYDTDGAGPTVPSLVVGGIIDKAGNKDVRHIVMWDGANWTGVGGGTATGVYSVAARNAAGGGLEPALYAGGLFKEAGGTVVKNIARYGCSDSVEVCRAEMSGDCQLDIFDFLAFVNLFNDGSDLADFTGDGVLDLFDFLGYVNTFNAGC
jgi:trimeric autotransporter adhesin